MRISRRSTSRWSSSTTTIDGHAGLQRAAHDRALGRAVEPLEQREQAVEAQAAGGRERVVGIRWGRRVGHDR